VCVCVCVCVGGAELYSQRKSMPIYKFSLYAETI
jgi:hypothetical protein